MQVYPLAAADGVVLSKTFTHTSEGYDTKQYPSAKNFTSFEYTVNTIEELYEVIKQHGAQGHALLKGQLEAPLIDESRAGKTDPTTATEFIMMDFDLETGYDSPDEMIEDLGPEFYDVSYIIQDSSSAGIKYPQGLRCHVFFMLCKPHNPTMLKLWLQHKNFSITILSDQLTLNADKVSLAYPLDIGSCENHRPLYIAPPVCTNFDDPITDRTRLVKKGSDTLTIDVTGLDKAVIDEAKNTFINAIRQAQGLKARKAKFTSVGRVRVISNPNEATVTGIKTERGFTYLNLNGGDSWGYYYPENNPKILYSFKGEDPVLLKELAPSYYYSLQPKRSVDGMVPLAFREFITDTYYNVKVYPDDNQIEMSKTASILRMEHFMEQYGATLQLPIEDWKIEFNPTTLKIWDKSEKWVNKYCPTRYLLEADTLPNTGSIPITIDKFLTSVFGLNEVKMHFINWLAYIFQTRKKTGTGWLVHGIEGTGKGVMFHKIIKPLLGGPFTNMVTAQNFLEQFNKMTATSIVTWVDEFDVELNESTRIMNKLKNLITEEVQTIREMRTDAYESQNYTNVILASNQKNALPVSMTDRRFNIAPRQEKPISTSKEEVELIEQELPYFAGYLHNWQVDLQQVYKPMWTEEKRRMQVASLTDTAQFFDAVKDGDIDYFLNFLRPDNILFDDSYLQYSSIVTDWLQHSADESGQVSVKVSREELRSLFCYITGQKLSPAKFSRKSAKEGLPITLIKAGGKVLRGVHFIYKYEEEHNDHLRQKKSNVVKIK